MHSSGFFSPRKHNKIKSRPAVTVGNIVLSRSYRIPWLVMTSLLVVILVRILEGMFIVGLAGSTVVLLITFVEDAELLLGREDSHHP